MTQLSEQKTIVFLVRNSVIIGGVETTLLGWLKHLDRTRFEPILFCFDQSDNAQAPFLDYLAGHGLTASCLPWGRVKNLPGAVAALSAEIRKYPAQRCVIHTQDVRSDLVGWLASKRTGVPVMASNHGWHSMWSGMSRKLHWVEALRGKLLQRFEKVLEVSESTRDISIARGIDPNRTLTLQTGIEIGDLQDGLLAQREAIRAHLGIKPGQIIIGNIARLFPEKGQKHILEAAQYVVPRCPACEFWIVGDGPLRDELRQDAARLEVPDSVRFIPFREDFREIMVALDVFTLPSYAEGAPMVIYEAMALERAIVATDIAGNVENLDDEQTALLLAPGDAHALGIQLLRCATDEALRTSLGKSASRALRAKPQLTVEGSTRLLEAQYRDVAALPAR